MTRQTGATIGAAELEEYRRVLRDKEEEVRQRLSAAHAAEVVQRPDEPLDFGDWCQKSHEEWLFLNQNRLEVSLFREIQGALRRLEEGVFGLCQECHAPISGKRLQAVPWAKLCMSCQQRASAPGGTG